MNIKLPDSPVDKDGNPLLKPLEEIIAFDIAKGLEPIEIRQRRGLSRLRYKSIIAKPALLKLVSDWKTAIKSALLESNFGYKKVLQDIIASASKAKIKGATLTEIIQAIEKIARMDGSFAPTKVEVSPAKQLTDDELEAIHIANTKRLLGGSEAYETTPDKPETKAPVYPKRYSVNRNENVSRQGRRRVSNKKGKQ